jgi:hypothetical protein
VSWETFLPRNDCILPPALLPVYPPHLSDERPPEGYRKKKLAEVPEGLNEFGKMFFLVRRQATDEVIGKEEFIVFVGPKEKAARIKRGEITEGVLVRMVRGRATVVGLSNLALAWLNGWER